MGPRLACGRAVAWLQRAEGHGVQRRCVPSVVALCSAVVLVAVWLCGCVAVECCLMCDNAVARTESARVEICIAGGIAAVLSAMKGFPKDALVQHHACLSIMNLAFNSGA